MLVMYSFRYLGSRILVYHQCPVCVKHLSIDMRTIYVLYVCVWAADVRVSYLQADFRVQFGGWCRWW